ncbi:aspartate/glutamate racemase family protein [Roseomonas sp. PWR1]|uniref:Aspartate/glutamate racemase family protein n=1 Tax=Roseomonas nitratireducens TaxID=2820810 RepID=A0ABS4AMB0_9PROT|nr:aspartate/glutamate racemase family protein [Neoroseomonas nitratireducens]MBP0462500.1 aspartate/glutamate racemase family protein [Neoroseomonas nitratireducens]
MRLLLLNGNTDSGITARLAALAEEAIPRLGLPAAQVVPATAPFGARYISTRAAVAIASHAVLAGLAANLGPANEAGFDAALIACFGEPGIEAAREVFPLPIVGMAEASIAAGLARAPRVALLTGGALWVPMLEEFARVRGFGPDRVMVRGVTPTGDMIARDPDGAVALLAEAARAAAADGAGVVVLGGAGLAGLAPRVAPLAGVPVLDSFDCALSAALGGRAPRGAPAAQAPMLGIDPSLARCFA